MTNFELKAYDEILAGDLIHLWHTSEELMIVINVEPHRRPGWFNINCIRGGRIRVFSMTDSDMIRVLKC